MKKRFLVVGIFVIFAIITYLDRNSISAIGSSITGELGLNDKQWGLILAAFSLAYGLFEIPTGMMAGQLGSAIMASAFGYILHSTGSYEIPVRIIGCLVIVGG